MTEPLDPSAAGRALHALRKTPTASLAMACQRCGTRFLAKQRNAKWCSERCKQAAKATRQKAAKAAGSGN